MGLFATLVYLAVLIITPGALLPELARFRVQWWFGGLAVLLTAGLVPVYGYPIRNIQTVLMSAFFVQVLMSRLMLGWLGGTLFALVEFGSIAVVFFLLVAGRPSVTRLKWIAVTLTLPALYAVFRGIGAVYFHWQPDIYILNQNLLSIDWTVLDVVQRIRFLGFFSDPNDLAQYFLLCVPMVGLLWRKGQHVRNFVLVMPIMLLLFFGMYLTHSRGVLVGLVVVMMAFLYDKFNKTVMAFGSAAVAIAGLAANFSGGRAISFSSGSDRIEAWGAGFAMLRSHPLFGVGYNLFVDHNELTAHNSFVLCFAELGLIGFFVWLGLLVSTILGLNQFLRRYASVPAARDLVRWATALRISLLSFIATGWFLSRTYSILLYVMIAMWVIIDRSAASLAVQPASQPAAAPVRQPAPLRIQKRPWHWATATITVQVFCLVLLYAMVRARWAQ
jgi:putative inorganic carbon (hco3(-)) transporter